MNWRTTPAEHELFLDSSERSQSILIARADPATRQRLTRFLTESGHSIITAVDGVEAWELFTQHRPQMVITDLELPRLDGLGLCRKIREHHNYTFVIMLTSIADQRSMGRGFAAGADDFMTKPFDRVELSWRLYSGLRVLDLHDALERRIQQLDETRRSLELANADMQAGLAAAANAQRAMLPATKPCVARANCSWTYQPSDHLGGDSLNVFKLNDHRLGFFVADVCGHGVAASLLAVSLHRVLTPVLDGPSLLTADGNEDPLEFFSDPGRVLTRLNRQFPMKIEQGEYFTAVYGVLDTQTGTLRFCGAGHPHPILLSPRQAPRKLPTDGFPIGFSADEVYETQEVMLGPGDRVLVYSDGITESANANREQFGSQRLIELLQTYAQHSLDETVSGILSAADQWDATERRADDVSLILLELAGVASSANGGLNHWQQQSETAFLLR